MAERFTAKDFTKQADTLWTTSDRVNLEGLLRQAAATEDALTKFRRFLFEADDTSDDWNQCLRVVEAKAVELGLWRDPEDCPHCRAERQVGCQRGCK